VISIAGTLAGDICRIRRFAIATELMSDESGKPHHMQIGVEGSDKVCINTSKEFSGGRGG
jgi:hypothetical protein